MVAKPNHNPNPNRNPDPHLPDGGPAQVEVVAPRGAQVLAVVYGQPSREQRAARGRAHEEGVVPLEDDALARESGDVARGAQHVRRGLGRALRIEADVVPADVVKQVEEEVWLLAGELPPEDLLLDAAGGFCALRR